MTEMTTLDDVLDNAQILSLEHQIHLEAILGNHDWDVDLAEPRLEFTGPLIEFTDGPTIECTRFHWLGSAAPGPQSWLWAWANATAAGSAESVTALSRAVRDFGQRHGIAAFASGEVAFDSLPGSPTDPAEAAALIADAAKSVTGRWTSYSGRIGGGGTYMVFLVEHTVFELPPPTASSVASVLQRISDLQLTDQQDRVRRYALQRQLQAVFTPDRGYLTLIGSDFESTVEFDEHGRVSGVHRRIDWDRDDDDINTGDDLRLEYRGEPFTGEVVQDLRPEGALMSQQFYVNGIANGPSREWWSDGRPKSEGHVRWSIAVGVFRRWHPDGQLAEERHFDESGSLFNVLKWDKDGNIVNPPVPKLAVLARTPPLTAPQWRTRARVRITHETGVTTRVPSDAHFDRNYRVGEELTMYRGGRAGSGPDSSIWRLPVDGREIIFPDSCVQVIEVLEDHPPA